MSYVHTISENNFEQLDNGIEKFEFITIKHNGKLIPALITNVQSLLTVDELALSLEPVYAVPTNFPDVITITHGDTNITVQPVTNVREVNTLAFHC